MFKYLKLLFLLFIFLLFGCDNDKQQIKQIILSKSEVEIFVEEEVLINAEVFPSNVDDVFIQWTSSDTSIAKVIDGNIKGVSPGVSVITAKVGKKIATCKVRVKKIEYEVVFNSCGGSKIASVKVPSGEKLIRPIHPTKAGHYFLGWFVDSRCIEAFSFNIEINEPLTLYAKWEPMKCKISFFTGTNEIINPLIIEYNQYAHKPLDPVREGYKFCGWYKDSSLNIPFSFAGENIHEDITLFAKWEILKYQVTFILNNGQENETFYCEWNTWLSKPTPPVKEGYTFVGWYLESSFIVPFDFAAIRIKKDYNLYGKWEIIKLKMEFETNGGSKIEKTIVNWMTAGEAPNDPIKEGHTFKGWYRDEALVNIYDFSTLVTKDIKLYAKWEINTYTVKFDLDGTGNIEPIQVLYNETIEEVEAPKKRGYIFTGWFTNLEFYTPFTFDDPIKKDTTIYAKFEEDPFKTLVNFDLDGGKWSIDCYEGFIDKKPRQEFTIFYNLPFDEDSDHYQNKLLLYSMESAPNLLVNSSDFYIVGINYHPRGYYYVASIFQEFADYNFNDFDYILICNESYLEGYQFIKSINISDIITIDGNLNQGNNLKVLVYDKNTSVYATEGLYEYFISLPKPVKGGFHFVGWFDGSLRVDIVIGKVNVKALWEKIN